jgi:hypothetical protein
MAFETSFVRIAKFWRCALTEEVLPVFDIRSDRGTEEDRSDYIVE